MKGTFGVRFVVDVEGRVETDHGGGEGPDAKGTRLEGRDCGGDERGAVKGGRDAYLGGAAHCRRACG